MPARPRPLAAPSMTLRFACSTAAASAASSGVEGASSAREETAMVLATSPAAWPPMPSATAKSGNRMTKESSLWSRTQPTSVREPQASEPVPLAAPEMRSVAEERVGCTGAATGVKGIVWSGPSSVMRAASSIWSMGAVSSGPGCGVPSGSVCPSSLPSRTGLSCGSAGSGGISLVRVSGSGSLTSWVPSSEASAANASSSPSGAGAPGARVSSSVIGASPS